MVLSSHIAIGCLCAAAISDVSSAAITNVKTGVKLGFAGPMQASFKRPLRNRSGVSMVATTGADYSLPPRFDESSVRLSKARERLFAATVDNAGGVDEVTGMRKETRVRELNLKVAEPEVRYDPARLEQELFKQPATWLLRNVQLFFPLAGFFFSVLTDIQSGREVRNRQLRAEQLLKIISGLGPAIIKGNVLSGLSAALLYASPVAADFV
jgi:hypothetical protein